MAFSFPNNSRTVFHTSFSLPFHSFRLSKSLIISLLLWVGVVSAYAGNITAGTNKTTWTSTKVGGTNYASTDDITFSSWNYTYTLTENITCANLNVNSGVTINLAGYTLTVTGNLTIGDNTVTMNVGSGKLAIAGNLSMSNYYSSGIFTTAAGVVELGGNLTAKNNGATMAGGTSGFAGTLRLTGATAPAISLTSAPIAIATLDLYCKIPFTLPSTFTVTNVINAGPCNPSLSTTALTGFGNVCTSSTAGPNSFTITGISLSTANVTVAALPGFTYSTTAGGTYTSTLSLPQSGGLYSQTIYVKFTPTAVASYNGNIVVGGGGAPNNNVTVTGSGASSVAPTLTSPTASNIFFTSVTLGGNITIEGCSAQSITERGIYYSTTNGFADGTGTKVSEKGTFGTGIFTINVTGLSPSTTYYYKAFATNGSGTAYTTQGTFNNIPVTYYSAKSGNWTSPSTWSTVGCGNAINDGTYPAPVDNVIICQQYNITVNTTGLSCNNLDMSAYQSQLTLNNDFTINGTLTLANQSHISAGANNLTISGDFSFDGANDYISWTNGTVTFGGNLSYSFGWGTVGLNCTGTGWLAMSGSSKTFTVNNNLSLPRFRQPYTSFTKAGGGTLTVSTTFDRNCGPAPTLTAGIFTVTGSTINASCTPKYFRSVTSGNWSNTSTWQQSADLGTTWVTATTTPTVTDGLVTIQSGNQVTLTAASGANSLVINGSLDVNTYALSGAGNLSVGSAGRLLVGGISNFPTGFTTTLNTGSTVNYYQTGNQTVSGQTYSNLTLSGSGTKTITGITINGILSMEGTSTAAGTNLTYGTTATLQYKGSTAQTTGAELPASFNGTGGVIINNTNGVTLGSASTIGTASKLILTTGILTTVTNSLSIANTSSAAIAGGSVTNFINGPVKWALPSGLLSGNAYVFPIGKGSSYLPFTLVNPTTGSVPVVQVEAFNTGSGGSYDASLNSISTSEYWALSIVSGTLTNSSVSLGRQKVYPYNSIGGSTVKNGTPAYSSLGGKVTDPNNISMSNLIGNNRFFVLSNCTNYWNGTYDTNWNNASNWSLGVPYSGYDITFASSPAHNLILDQDRTIGNLSNLSQQQLIIPPAKCLTVNGIITTSNDDQIYIQSSPTSPNGSLIFPNATNVHATVEMYSKAFCQYPITKTGYKWQYFGIPVSSMTASPTLNGSYVRSWDETAPDSTRWMPLKNTSVLNPFMGYEMTQLSAKTVLFKGQLVNSDFNSGTLSFTPNAVFPGQHIFANPYTAAIDISKLSFGSTDSQVIENTVYLYSTGSFSDWTSTSGVPVSYGSSPSFGQYTSIPVSLAGHLGLPGQIPSMQGILIRVNSSVPAANFSISYNAVAIKDTVQQRVSTIKTGSTSEDKVGTSILVTGSRYSDQMWLFSESGCTHNFDNGWDGAKIIGSSLTPQIFAIEQDGNYQVDAVNDINDTQLGFQAGEDVAYTLTFTHQNIKNNYAGMYLVDLVENKTVDITESGSTYSFVTESTPAPVKRFIIATRNYEKNAPDENTQLKVFSSGNKVFVQNLSNLNGELVIYDMMGRYLKKANFGPSGVTAISAGTTPGAYVVNASTANERVSKRIFIGE
ncbi:MAG: T9SS type A sorting domain-containing protein [Bacteroidota bacterium]|nr:T9SS type A sorting domain-containing protein [Bacteroidota bacterium]